jgi:hypothetical protein
MQAFPQITQKHQAENQETGDKKSREQQFKRLAILVAAAFFARNRSFAI